MHKGRVEAFSDGVIAIIITIMVLELKVPHGTEWSDLHNLLPTFLSYLLSFVYLAIYWNNHHHLFQTVHKVNGRILWANTHLLFWLSLIPFATAWSGEHNFATVPVFCYGFTLAMAGVAYYILAQTLISSHGKDSVLAQAIGKDIKGKISVVLYMLGMASTLIHPLISIGVYAIVAMIWLVPDQRIEGKVL